MTSSLKFDPYAVLGIERTAAPDEVKAAFRRRAKDCHPDVAPDKRQEFEDVTKANLILSDPALRSKYDRTGEIDDDRTDNATSDAVGVLMTMFIGIIAECEKQGVDPVSVNMIETVRRNVQACIVALEESKKPPLKSAEQLARVERRLRPRGQRNLVNLALRQQIEVHKAAAATIDKQIKCQHDALLMLDDYLFDVEMLMTIGLVNYQI